MLHGGENGTLGQKSSLSHQVERTFLPVRVEDFQGCTRLSLCERDLHACMLIIHGDRVQHLPIQCKELTHGKDITYGKFQADLRGLCGPLIYFGCVNPWAPTVKLADLKHPPCLL